MLPGQRPKNNLRALLQEKLTVMRSKGNQGKNQTTQSGPNSSNKQDEKQKTDPNPKASNNVSADPEKINAEQLAAKKYFFKQLDKLFEFHTNNQVQQAVKVAAEGWEKGKNPFGTEDYLKKMKDIHAALVEEIAGKKTHQIVNSSIDDIVLSTPRNTAVQNNAPAKKSAPIPENKAANQSQKLVLQEYKGSLEEEQAFLTILKTISALHEKNKLVDAANQPKSGSKEGDVIAKEKAPNFDVRLKIFTSLINYELGTDPAYIYAALRKNSMPSSAKYISQWLGILFAEYEKLQKPDLHKQIANFIQTEIKNTEVRISELTSLQVQPVLLAGDNASVTCKM